jgi:hypothetical protein
VTYSVLTGGERHHVLAILVLVEFVASGLVASAIAWLRYLYGAPMSRDWHATMVRYLVPFLMPILVVLFISMSITHRAEQQPDTYPPDVGFAVGLGIALVLLLVWLVVEVGRYRAHHRRRRDEPRLGEGKNRAR